MSAQVQTKAAVSVAEMARMCGLSRSRFYALIGTAFPRPERQPETDRPVYSEEQQKICLEVRRRNCGIDGKPVLFYVRRTTSAPSKPKTTKPKLAANRGDLTTLIDGLNALGLTVATAAEVQRVTDQLYPSGTANIDRGEVLRAVFLHLKRQNSADKVG